MRERPAVVFMAPFGSLNGANRSMLLLAEYLQPWARTSVVGLEYDAALVAHAKARGVRFLTAVGEGEDVSRAARLVRAVAVLRGEAKLQGAAVIVANTARAMRFAWPVARLLGARVVCHQRDPYFRNYYHLGIGGADRIIVPSQFTSGTLPQRLRERTRVHYNPVEVPPAGALGFKANAGWSERWRQGGPIRIGLAGLCYPKKGHDLLLKAAPRVLREFPTAEFHIWGASPKQSVSTYLAELKQLAAPLGDRVQFSGFDSNMSPFYQTMDVVVQPSRFTETFGRVAAEALAYATPTVAANRGSLPEVVIDGTTGYLHEPDNAAALADVLLTVLGAPAEAEARGRAGRADVAQRFDPQHHARALWEEFQSL